MGISVEIWCRLVNDFGKLFSVVAGQPRRINEHRSKGSSRRYRSRKETRELMRRRSPPRECLKWHQDGLFGVFAILQDSPCGHSSLPQFQIPIPTHSVTMMARVSKSPGTESGTQFVANRYKTLYNVERAVAEGSMAQSM